NAVLGSVSVSAAGVCLWWSVAGDRRLRRSAVVNLRSGLAPGRDLRAHQLAAPASERAVLPVLQRVTAFVRRFAPSSAVDNLNRRIVRAGKSSTWPVERTLAAKVLLGAVGSLVGLALLTSGNPIGVVYGFIVPPLFFFAPDLVLRAKAKA